MKTDIYFGKSWKKINDKIDQLINYLHSIPFDFKFWLQTFLDWLIILDCSLCIITILNICIYKVGSQGVIGFYFCFPWFSLFFLALCNKLLTVSIVIYRYIFVAHSSIVETKRKRTVFKLLLFLFILLPSALLTSAAVYHRENSFYYLRKYFLVNVTSPFKTFQFKNVEGNMSTSTIRMISMKISQVRPQNGVCP